MSGKNKDLCRQAQGGQEEEGGSGGPAADQAEEDHSGGGEGFKDCSKEGKREQDEEH